MYNSLDAPWQEELIILHSGERTLRLDFHFNHQRFLADVDSSWGWITVIKNLYENDPVTFREGHFTHNKTAYYWTLLGSLTRRDLCKPVTVCRLGDGLWSCQFDNLKRFLTITEAEAWGFINEIQ